MSEPTQQDLDSAMKLVKSVQQSASDLGVSYGGFIATIGALITGLYREEPTCRTAIVQMLDKLADKLISIDADSCRN